MPPKQAKDAKPAGGKTAFLPPQRATDAAAKDPQATSVEKPAAGSAVSGRPDKAVYEKEQEGIKAEIEVLQAKVNEARGKIGGKGTPNPLAERRKALREELDGLREQQSKNKSSRDRTLEQVKQLQEGMQRKIKDLNAAKGKLPFKSTAEVDAKIRTLESSVDAGTLRLVEEKRTLAEIQALKKQKKQVEGFGPQQTAIEEDRAKVDELRKLLDDPESKAASQRWNDIKAEIDKISQEMQEQGKDRDKLYENRNELQKQLDELYGRKRDSAAKYKEANDKYYAKLQEDRQRRIERQKAERDAYESGKRLEEATRLREEASAPAYEREIEDCRTLIGYFERLTGAASSDVTEPKLSTNGAVGSRLPPPPEGRQLEVDNDAFKGMTAVKKKGADQEDFFSGSGGKKGKKGKKGPAPSDAATTQALQLPLATLTALLALGVPTPMTRDEVAGTIAALTEKRKWFSENQERVTKERIAAAEKKITAAESKVKGKTPDDTTPVDAKAKTPIDAVEEVREKLGDSAVPVDRESVAVENVVDTTGEEVVPAAEQA